jgi:hypothetical protein
MEWEEIDDEHVASPCGYHVEVAEWNGNSAQGRDPVLKAHEEK